MEVSTTKVSSKGQVVIPISVRRAAGVREGERLLPIALGNTIILKRIVDEGFEETVRSIWAKVRQMGLTEEDIDTIILYLKLVLLH